jgi:predicted CopG family antitoxin
MVKVISISDDVYKRLKNIKGEKSFSEILTDLLNSEKVNPKLLQKYFKILSNEESDKLEKDTNEGRKRSVSRGSNDY